MERNGGTYSSSSRVALTITQGITNDNGEAVRNKKKLNQYFEIPKFLKRDWI